MHFQSSVPTLLALVSLSAWVGTVTGVIHTLSHVKHIANGNANKYRISPLGIAGYSCSTRTTKDFVRCLNHGRQNKSVHSACRQAGAAEVIDVSG